MKNKVAGILRVKNEGCFIKKCVESCIDALDELLITYNDCTDNSVEEIEKMAAKYPDKIKVYPYPYEIKAFDLSKEEYDNVRNLPEDSPQLFSSYSNFILSKVTAEYVLKIDADQVYFPDMMKLWCDYMRNCRPERMNYKSFLGKLFQFYLSFFRTISLKCGKPLAIMPTWLVKMMYPFYLSYAKYLFSHDKASLSLSGINVLETDSTLISMGHESDILLMLCPFNGVGDTVMFKKTDQTYFKRIIMNEFNSGKTNGFVVAEEFVQPYRMMYIGYFWKHVRTMRPGVKEQALKAYDIDSSSFLNIEDFKKLSYNQIKQHSPDRIFFPFQKILFEFVYKANKKQLFKSLENQNRYEYD